jgi:hypothetical protein
MQITACYLTLALVQNVEHHAHGKLSWKPWKMLAGKSVRELQHLPEIITVFRAMTNAVR